MPIGPERKSPEFFQALFLFGDQDRMVIVEHLKYMLQRNLHFNGTKKAQHLLGFSLVLDSFW
jgi:hypothetical protein